MAGGKTWANLRELEGEGVGLVGAEGVDMVAIYLSDMSDHTFILYLGPILQNQIWMSTYL